jgi:hypothetical protein
MTKPVNATTRRAISLGSARSDQSEHRLTPGDFDELRKIQAATDAKRDPPPLPREIAGKLRAFGLVTASAGGSPVITDRGRGALLEQDMRDAEDR